ncbi:unnamed protein product [Albugo candida]|uniref:Uncharacterized protein n=1 Tax=Albugo candida TaxID=65357 RepID=A0A024GPP6_9STRA|nr:unnamed protein product [Albugo candida]|eukprot:CCI48769.1 unnamed protein product [Albugo candida]
MTSIRSSHDATRYSIPSGDFAKYLIGHWKRNLDWRHFGGSFKHLRVTNNVVLIEEDDDAAAQPSTKFLRWSYGKTCKLQDLTAAYSIQFLPSDECTFMEWSFEGVKCHGVFTNVSNVATLNFCLPTAMVTITYRVLDRDTMAVCIVDVDNDHTPTIQFGHMYRIDPEKYRSDDYEM